MRRHEPELRQRGIALVFVGTGTAAQAAAFAATHAGAWPVLSDPTRRVFAAAAMRRSLWATLHWRFVGNLVRAWRQGFRQRRIEGDAWQQGGVVLFGADGRVLHMQRDTAAGDPIDVAALFPAGARS